MAAFWGALYDLGRWAVLFTLSPIHLDFRIFYVAAQAGLQQGWSSMYDVGVLRALSTGFPPAERFVDSRSAFISPPAFAWILTPLTAMPLPAAYLVWTLVSLGALVLAWYLVAPYRGLAKASLLLLALAVWPVMESFYWGQPSLEVLGLVAVAWSLNQRGRPAAGGVALALAVALKPNIIVLVPLALLVSGRFRIFVAFAVASPPALTGLLPFVPPPPPTPFAARMAVGAMVTVGASSPMRPPEPPPPPPPRSFPFMRTAGPPPAPPA
jgi:hypothetical protein